MKYLFQIRRLFPILLLLVVSLVTPVFAEDTLPEDLTLPAITEETEAVLSEEAIEEPPMETKDWYPTHRMPTRGLALENYVNLDAFINYVANEMASCPDYVDVSSFEIPHNDAIWEEIKSLIWYETPEIFHCCSLGRSHNSTTLLKISADYYAFSDTAAEFAACNKAFMEGANELLKGVEGNNQLNTLTKALILHDRLAVWTRYDEIKEYGNERYTAYGVFGNKVAVCQGYAMAYMYLLERVGIESDYCSSQNLNHGWNIVYIDGKAYHVDVTWDDPTSDIIGRVHHDNFMRSTAGIIATGHDGGDFITTPVTTTYDNAFWQKSYASFYHIGNKLYYLDAEVEKIRSVSAGNTAANPTIADVVSADGDWTYYYSEPFYTDSFARLAIAGANLLYNGPDAVYMVDPVGKTVQEIYRPALNASEEIYGFSYEEGQLVLHINDTPSQMRLDSSARILKVTWTPAVEKYTITFLDWDGTVLSTAVYEKGATVQKPTNPTRPDSVNYTYTFAGWSPAVTTVTGDATYTATYTKTLKPSYTIIFKNWDGTVLSEKTYREGATVSAPATPTRPDTSSYSYVFAGWSPTFSATAKGNVTYTATYTAVPKATYTITFLDWDGTVLSQKTYKSGATVQKPANPTRPDGVNYYYTFAGWSPEVSATAVADATYTATYSRTLKPVTRLFLRTGTARSLAKRPTGRALLFRSQRIPPDRTRVATAMSLPAGLPHSAPLRRAM